jgi:hypothetical protein
LPSPIPGLKPAIYQFQRAQEPGQCARPSHGHDIVHAPTDTLYKHRVGIPALGHLFEDSLRVRL